MSLELIREPIKVIQVIGEDSTQTVVENDIIVPDVKPDIARILILDGESCVDGCEVMQDKVQVSGALRFKIIYIADDPNQSVKSINTSSNFSYSMDMLGSRQGMRGKAKCDIEHIEYNILNGRKVNIKAVLKLDSKVTDEIDQNVVNDLRGIENLQILRDSININCYLGSSELGHTVRESLEIPAGKPAIMEILRNDVKISGKDYKITDNKVIVKGELNISTLYIGDDENRSIQFVEHDVAFTQFVDLQGINDNSGCQVEYYITDSQFEPAEDSDGELRVLNGEVNLGIKVEGFDKRSVEVIGDAYSPRVRLSLEKEPFKTEDVIFDNKAQVVVKDTVIISSDSPEIEEVFNVIFKPSITEARVFDGKVIVEGVVNSSILYLVNNTEQPVLCKQHEVPFKHSIDIKGIKADMRCDIDLDVESSSYSMLSGTEVEVRAVVAVGARVINQGTVPLIIKVGEQYIDEKRIASQPSIIIYFSQPGDTLWKIAKKYYTTVDEIKNVNNLTERDIITPGQQIVIPKWTA